MRWLPMAKRAELHANYSRFPPIPSIAFHLPHDHEHWGQRSGPSASLGMQRESLLQESASCDDSHLPSIPASRGPSPAARVAAASVGVHFL